METFEMGIFEAVKKRKIAFEAEIQYVPDVYAMVCCKLSWWVAASCNLGVMAFNKYAAAGPSRLRNVADCWSRIWASSLEALMITRTMSSSSLRR